MDKYRSITRLPLVEARLQQLLGRLGRNYGLGGYRTQEELARAYAAVAKRYARGFDRRAYDLPRARYGAPLSEDDLNDTLFGLFSEAKYLLEATKGTGEAIESNFNFAVADIQSLQAQLKYCKQSLSVFSLYARHFGTDILFGETFSNGENLDVGSSFIEGKECHVDLSTGTITLPLIEGEAQHEIEVVEVSGASNGFLGNNVEAGTPVRGSITAMYDGNADTWTEYERVVSREDTEGLLLELKVSLKDIKPVNAVRIHPVFLGARTVPVVSSLELSKDGRRWASIEDDIRVAEDMGETPEERFHLAPSSSRYAGEFYITFAPRFAKFVRIRIRQSSAFTITDAYGVKRLRYAVGVKELSIFGWKYEPQGELLSKQITMPRGFTSLALQPLLDPYPLPPEIGGGEYFFSLDDGATWAQVMPLDEASASIPEILTLPEEASSFRYKVRLYKREENFSLLDEESAIKSMTEIHSPSLRRPQTFQLQQVPVDGTLSLCNPSVAARGKYYPPVVIGTGVPSTLVEDVGVGGAWERHGNTQLRIPLPIRGIKDASVLHIAVNGIPWGRVENVTSFSGLHNEEYVLRQVTTPTAPGGTGDAVPDKWEVVFGNGDASVPMGRIPGVADKISLVLEEETVAVEGVQEPYTIKLDYTSSGKKADTTILYSRGSINGSASQIIPAGVAKFRLARGNICLPPVQYVWVTVRSSLGALVGTSYSAGVGTATNFLLYKDFVNGDTEIPNPGDWTVDSLNGVVYSRSGAVGGGHETTVSYFWQDVTYLADSEWDFAEGKLDEIQVYQSGYHADEGSQNISSTSTAVALTGVWGLVTKSVRLSKWIFGSYSPFEVPFIDGSTEFEARGIMQDEEVPEAVAGVTSIASFRLTHWANLISTAGVAFSDISVFATQKANWASLLAPGDFYVDTTGLGPDGKGYCYVFLTAPGVQIPAGITVSYQYRDDFSAERMKGSYSVDCREGRVFFSMPTQIAGTVYFKHAPYRVRYTVSEQLEVDKDYTVNAAGKTFTLTADAPDLNYLYASYRYKEENTGEDLAPYFSPLLRALTVKAI